jgi:hypothetical protein
MMKFKMLLIGFSIILLLVIAYFFVGSPPQPDSISFGVNFSQKHAAHLGLDWRKTYEAILDDLKVKELKIISHWDLIEGQRGEFHFEDLDWQIEEAAKRNANVILVIGMKTGRWPECHIPEWAKDLSKQGQQERILKLLGEVVSRYKDKKVIWAWQAENEPLFPFGECHWKDKEFLAKEIALIRSLDPSRPVIFSDSGEGSFWTTAARMADIVGITMYKKVWFTQLNSYVYYPLPPVFYWRKALIIKYLFDKDVMVTELQAEPWGPKLLYDISLEEQDKTMNLARFKYNVDFARRTGFSKFYLWGAEWWYWLKENNQMPDIWDQARTLF